MAKGLSDIQKRILRVISELSEGVGIFCAYDNIKVALYPDLYIKRYTGEFGKIEGASLGATARLMNVSRSTISRDLKKDPLHINTRWTSRCSRYYGDGDKKNVARVVISRAINRLEKRGYLKKEDGCISITDKGKQAITVNDVQSGTPLTDKGINKHAENEQEMNLITVNDVPDGTPLTDKTCSTGMI